MKSFLLELEKIEAEYKEYFGKKDSHKLKHYIMQQPSAIPNHTYIELDESALKNHPLPKEIEDKLRVAFKTREGLRP